MTHTLHQVAVDFPSSSATPVLSACSGSTPQPRAILGRQPPTASRVPPAPRLVSMRRKEKPWACTWGTGGMALAGGWRWDSRRWSFVLFPATMGRATEGGQFRRCLLLSSQAQGLPAHRAWGCGSEIVSNGPVKGSGEEQAQAWRSKRSAQGKDLRRPPLPLDLAGGGRVRPAGQEGAASPTVRVL